MPTLEEKTKRNLELAEKYRREREELRKASWVLEADAIKDKLNPRVPRGEQYWGPGQSPESTGLASSSRVDPISQYERQRRAGYTDVNERIRMAEDTFKSTGPWNSSGADDDVDMRELAQQVDQLTGSPPKPTAEQTFEGTGPWNANKKTYTDPNYHNLSPYDLKCQFDHIVEECKHLLKRHSKNEVNDSLFKSCRSSS